MPEYAFDVRAGATVITNTAVLWGPDLTLLERTSLTLAGGRIGGSVTGADAVDGSGLLCLPGFVDAHVHIGFADPAEVLGRGVTTVRDLGWPETEIFELAGASRSQAFDGPLILAAGPILTAPGGYPTRAAWAPPGTGREVATPAEAQEAVARLAAAGAHSIKVALDPPAGPVLGRDVLGAIARAAHVEGRKVTGHVHGMDELHKALDCGVDELAHMLMSEEELTDDVIGRMVAARTTIVPTLSIRFGRDRDVAVSNLARFRAAGGRVVYGTDLGNEGPAPGIDRREVAAMTAAGFTTIEVVKAATVDAARHLSLAGKGVLEEGMDADVVAVPVDALEHPEKLCDVRMVWRAGRRVA
jgi:imidazolonepropionase-like amidohydrolase